MKYKRNVFLILFIILAGLIYSPAQAQQKNDAQDVVYRLDIKKSKLLWQALKNSHKGFILFNSGTLSNFTNGKPTQGAFSINMNSMRSTDKTSVVKRKEVDDELRSEAFFAVSKYPAASMVVNNIVLQPNGTNYKVYGELTIKDITRPIEFTAAMRLNGAALTATANLNINRSDWNINHQPKPTWNMFNRMKDKLVDDDIPISLELVFIKN